MRTVAQVTDVDARGPMNVSTNIRNKMPPIQQNRREQHRRRIRRAAPKKPRAAPGTRRPKKSEKPKGRMPTELTVNEASKGDGDVTFPIGSRNTARMWKRKTQQLARLENPPATGTGKSGGIGEGFGDDLAAERENPEDEAEAVGVAARASQDAVANRQNTEQDRDAQGVGVDDAKAP